MRREVGALFTFHTSTKSFGKSVMKREGRILRSRSLNGWPKADGRLDQAPPVVLGRGCRASAGRCLGLRGGIGHGARRWESTEETNESTSTPSSRTRTSTR
jgi:hypothetical protein